MPRSTSKMSKSSKFITIQEVIELYHPLALRYFLLAPVNYTTQSHRKLHQKLFSTYIRTVYFGEFDCSGPGANMTYRVPYAREMKQTEADPYLTTSYVDGDDWLLNSLP
ncbi:hypothetical protein DM860_001183 [Cuscuta australis]|uniref:Pectinesterase n=1 Tax=Cuscuta australis TaxID=267555 RepID=A0A328DXM2_9ASTE|nr:hypothetical protein DM860_001183 [Cuscuta australis]